MSDIAPYPASSSQPNADAINADFEFAALREAINYRAALITSFRPWLHGHILEIGAGIGQMSEALRSLPEVKKHLAVEPDNRFLTTLREKLPAADILEGTAANVPASQSWDALVSINVLEHIGHDEAELALYARLLAPRRGHLCLFVPACQEIYAPLDKDFGHYRRYNRAGLHTKLESAGFEIVRMRYYNVLGYFAWWWTFCVLKKRSFNIASVRFYDRFLFPPVFWMENTHCRPPVGQSLLVVARAKNTELFQSESGRQGR
jgi:SAM-dependent methyltransferase